MTAVDRTIATMGLPSHPTPKVLAAHLRVVASLLETEGRIAIVTAGVLSSRGFPTGTLGDGTGSRSTSTSTSVERAAGADRDVTPDQLDPGHFAGVDRRLASLLRLTWKAGLDIQQVIGDVLAHGQDVDQVPVGHGECECCGRMCRPAKNPDDRLRSGFCDSCRKAWDRAGRPDRTDWAHARRHTLRDGQKGICERCGRPWASIEGVAS